MAEITQITFSYKDSSYRAEVHKVDGSLYINFPDAALHHIVPSGKIAVDLKQVLPTNADSITEKQGLILSVLGSMVDQQDEHPSVAKTQQLFDAIFNNAKANSIIIMDEKGIIQQVNRAFTTAFGYTTEELKSKHTRTLFLQKDQLTLLPEIELNQTHREGASSDENYLVHKDGTSIWVTGESILVKIDDSTCIVKIIHNIHAQKQLERYLLSTTELLDSLFESVQSGLIILDSSLKIVKTNKPFYKLFHLAEPFPRGAKLQQLNHPFWSGDEIRNDLRNVLVSAKALNREYLVDKGNREFNRLHINSKTIMNDDGTDRQILLMIREV
jgi:PAS domain S-box-containing protein